MAYAHVFSLTGALGLFALYYGYRLRRYTEDVVETQDANAERGDWSFIRGGNESASNDDRTRDPKYEPPRERETESESEPADETESGAEGGTETESGSTPTAGPPREERIAAKERQGLYWAAGGVVLVVASAAAYVLV